MADTGREPPTGPPLQAKHGGALAENARRGSGAPPGQSFACLSGHAVDLGFSLAILDSLPAQLCVVENSGQIIAVNAAWQDFAIKNAGEFARCGLGQNYLAVCRNAKGNEIGQAREAGLGIQAILDGTIDVFRFEYPCHSPDERRWFLMHAVPIVRGDGADRMAVISHLNITERKFAEEALRESQRLTHQMIDSIITFVCVLKTDGTVLQINRAASLEMSLTPERIVGETFAHLELWSYSSGVQDRLRRAIGKAARGDASRYDEVVHAGDGRFMTVDFQVVPMFEDEGRVNCLVASAMDITDRKMLQEELLTIVEREQQRIGQDLHDDIGQQLTGVTLMADTLSESLDASGPENIALALRVRDRLSKIQEALRAISRDLVPAVVGNQGLMAALEDLASRVTEENHRSCEFKCHETVPIKDNRIATYLYRIAQEAIANAIRHGAATDIQIALSRFGSGYTLTIEDNGIGISQASLSGPGMGLKIMRYRATHIGGTLIVESMNGGGTRVSCVVGGSQING